MNFLHSYVQRNKQYKYLPKTKNAHTGKIKDTRGRGKTLPRLFLCLVILKFVDNAQKSFLSLYILRMEIYGKMSIIINVIKRYPTG